MKAILKNALLLAGLAAAGPVAAQITFYERDAFEGRSFSTRKEVWNMERYGFNDRASSAVVTKDRWEVCDDAGFKGGCRVLRPGNYPSLSAMGLGNRISSVRIVATSAPVNNERFAPAPMVSQDYRRRDRERIYDAEVIEVRAVVGPAEQRCWVEHNQVSEDRTQGNIVGGIAGAVIGGILGHQVGGGRGKDLATAGGAVAGGAIGMNVARNRDGQPEFKQDVQRCREVQSRAEPEYWDVTYTFRGREHQVQTAKRPGSTIQVNENGEPRA